MITVFTPAYNRSKELHDLYNSLCDQTNYDFEWLIVDDGSVDDTKKKFQNLKNNKFKIRYIHKKNGGKQSAYNVGLDNALGDIFLCIDSDDILDKKAIATINKDFKNLDNKCAGIAYTQAYISNPKKIIGTDFGNHKKAYYYDIYTKLQVKGDKLIVLKTDVAKKYPFPMISGEKFVPEALVFNRIAVKYKLQLSNLVLAYKEYLDGGYSNNYFNLVKKNPLGNRLYYLEDYQFHHTWHNIYGYLLFSFYGKIKFKQIISEHQAKFKIFLLYIPTFLIYKWR